MNYIGMKVEKNKVLRTGGKEKRKQKETKPPLKNM